MGWRCEVEVGGYCLVKGRWVGNVSKEKLYRWKGMFLLAFGRASESVSILYRFVCGWCSASKKDS